MKNIPPSRYRDREQPSKVCARVSNEFLVAQTIANENRLPEKSHKNGGACAGLWLLWRELINREKNRPNVIGHPGGEGLSVRGHSQQALSLRLDELSNNFSIRINPSTPSCRGNNERVVKVCSLSAFSHLLWWKVKSVS